LNAIQMGQREIGVHHSIARRAGDAHLLETFLLASWTLGLHRGCPQSAPLYFFLFASRALSLYGRMLVLFFRYGSAGFALALDLGSSIADGYRVAGEVSGSALGEVRNMIVLALEQVSRCIHRELRLKRWSTETTLKE